MKKLLLTYFLGCTGFFALAQGPKNPATSNGFNGNADADRTVIIKLRKGISANTLQATLTDLKNNAAEVQKVHPDARQRSPAIMHSRESGNIQSSYGLERIYRFKADTEQDVSRIIHALQKHDFIEYAEPYYPVELLYIPNDPFANPVTGSQDNLSVIKAYEAWELEKGDSTMVIGILDTGVNLDHIDLKSNLFLNKADPPNGFDDDGDGYIDNYKGWDFADGDNDPSDVDGHGTQVAGIAAARTDNGIGIAGTGFKTKFMPIKVFTNQGSLFNDGYRAILYAAEKGCKVINLSWGSANNYSKYVEDIINTVVLDMDVVVVAAAGNSNLNEEYYPASYEYVMSVANTTKADEKAPGSTFSPYVDISAPGTAIMTTSGISGNLYGGAYGTSMAAPAVAGAAALVRAHYPELNALQVIERLRMTADDIYGVGNNAQYQEHLGKGRLNMVKALEDSSSCAVRFREIAYSNNLGPYAFYDDTLTITGKFVNYLQKASNLEVTLSTTSSYVTLIDSVFNILSLFTLGEEQATFRIYIKPNSPSGERLRFRLGYTGDDYEDYQYFDINTNPDYVTIDNGKLAMTIGSNGNLGYNGDYLNGGTGYVYNMDGTAESLWDFASLIIGTGPENVSDNMFNSYSTMVRAKDFRTEKRIKIIRDSPDFIQAVSSFSDKNSLNVGVLVSQSLSSYKEASLNNCLFLDYEIINNSGLKKDTLRIGLYADWDIVDSLSNRANYDFNYRMAYAYYPDQAIYGGIALLSAQEVAYQAIALYDESGNFIFGPQIKDDEKYSLLVRNDNRLATGPANIASILTSVVYGLENNAKENIQFVLTAGRSLEELQENIVEAVLRKRPYTVLAPISFCKGEDVIINPGLGSEVYFYTDSLLTQFIGKGNQIALTTTEEDFRIYMKQQEGLFYKGYEIAIRRERELKASFAMDKDSVIFDENKEAALFLMDDSQCAVRWEWSVNGVIAGYTPETTLLFDAPGSYIITLKVWDKTNKMDSLSKVLTVAYVTGVQKDKSNVLQAFPNPVSTTLSINMPLGKAGVISITDQIGRIHSRQTVTPKSQPYLLNIVDLSPGIYILRVETAEGNRTQKLVVQ